MSEHVLNIMNGKSYLILYFGTSAMQKRTKAKERKRMKEKIMLTNAIRPKIKQSPHNKYNFVVFGVCVHL